MKKKKPRGRHPSGGKRQSATSRSGRARSAPATLRSDRSDRSDRRRAGLAGLVVVMLVAGWIVWKWQSDENSARSAGGGPLDSMVPQVDLSGVDSAVATRVQEEMDAVRRSPQSAEAWGHLGLALWVNGFPNAGRDALAEARSREPDEGRWFYFTGLTFLPEDPASAIHWVRQSVERMDDTALAPPLRLATLLTEEGDYAAADEQLRRLLALHPDHSHVRFGAARAALGLGDRERAYQLLSASAQDPATAKRSNQLLSTVLLQRGEAAAAEAAKRRADALPADADWEDPFVAEASSFRVGKSAWMEHADTLMKDRRFPEALPLVEQILEGYPETVEAHIHLARIRLAQGDAEAASTSLREAIRLDPENVEARVQLGVVLMRQQLYPEAVGFLQEALRRAPDVAEAHFNLGLCWTSMGQFAEAAASYEAAIRYRPNLVDGYLGLADARRRLGQFDAAREPLETARHLAPNDPRVANLLQQLATQPE